MKAVAVALLCFLAGGVPWSIRNYRDFGHFGLSAHLGVNIFTKAVMHDLIDTECVEYRKISLPLANVMAAMKIPGISEPLHPEDAWDLNRVPHVLIDTLVKNHGYTYVRAGSLLSRIAVRSFVKHPWRYFRSVGKSFATLAFDHRDLFPEPGQVLPLEGLFRSSALAVRVATGFVYVSGFFLLIFPFVFFVKYPEPAGRAIPFCIVTGMFLITASLHVGLTRYAVPWEPFKAMCAAYCVEAAGLFFFRLLKAGKIRRKTGSSGIVLDK
jgi:hypothetical protein